MTRVLDESEMQAFINNHFGGQASQITRLSGGDWSQAYALSVDEKELAP